MLKKLRFCHILLTFSFSFPLALSLRHSHCATHACT